MMISYETEKNISISGVNKLIKKIEPEAYISENEENVKRLKLINPLYKLDLLQN